MLLAERIIPTGIMARSKMTVHPSHEFQEKAIALIIHSLDPSLSGSLSSSLSVRLRDLLSPWDVYRAGFTIAFVIHSVDLIQSLDPSGRLIPVDSIRWYDPSTVFYHGIARFVCFRPISAASSPADNILTPSSILCAHILRVSAVKKRDTC